MIWSVFVEDALRNQVRSGLLTHSSPYQKTVFGENLGELVPPEINSKLSKQKFKSDHELATAFIKEIAFCNSLSSTDDETFPSRLIRQLTPSLKYRGTSGDGLLTCVR